MTARTRPFPVDSEPVAHPPLKSVGGKTALLSKIIPHFPEKIRTYYEPFLGGGAVFFALATEGRFEHAVLGDANPEFTHVYVALKKDVDGVIRALKKHIYEEKHYYVVRAQDPYTLTLSVRAARCLYLNRVCFNGLWRVNKKGQFNVPFGRYTNPTICDEENLLAVAKVLQKVKLCAFDFAKTVETAGHGDVVYCDPPYAPVSETANFTAYTAGGFGSEEQTRLRNVVKKLATRGVYVLLSNSDTPFVRGLYSGFRIEGVQAPRRVNSNGGKRGNVGELLILRRGEK